MFKKKLMFGCLFLMMAITFTSAGEFGYNSLDLKIIETPISFETLAPPLWQLLIKMQTNTAKPAGRILPTIFSPPFSMSCHFASLYKSLQVNF